MKIELVKIADLGYLGRVITAVILLLKLDKKVLMIVAEALLLTEQVVNMVNLGILIKTPICILV